MTNDVLRAALDRQAMSPQQLAETVGVDAKTVGRWITDETRLPHPRHRWAVAAALEMEVQMIWPTAIRETLKTGADREVVSVYPCRSLMPRALWRDLITKAERHLIFGGYTNYFFWLKLPGLANALHRKAQSGADVRFIIGDPASSVTTDRERIEKVPLTVSTRIRVTLDELNKLHDRTTQVHARHSDQHIAMSIWRFDEDMIVCTHLADQLGNDSPTIHIRRKQDGGLFDRYNTHMEYLWRNGTTLWPSSEANTQVE